MKIPPVQWHSVSYPLRKLFITVIHIVPFLVVLQIERGHDEHKSIIRVTYVVVAFWILVCSCRSKSWLPQQEDIFQSALYVSWNPNIYFNKLS